MLQYTLVVWTMLTSGEISEEVHPMGFVGKETCEEAALAISKASPRKVARCVVSDPTPSTPTATPSTPTDEFRE